MAIANGERGRSRLRRKTDEHQLETAGMMRWLLTYADMITLLLALFIILFSISTINKVKLQRLVHDLGGGFSNPDAMNNPAHGGLRGREIGGAGEPDLERIERQLRAYIAANHLEAKMRLRIERRGLVITLLTDKALYDSGSAQLRPETRRILDRIDGALKTTRSEIRVEGNTDDVPIATSSYPTNWELSAARATGVTRYLVEHDGLSPTRISLAGYGQFRPTHRNDTEENRQQNRRVDIVILNAINPQNQQTAENTDVTSNTTSAPEETAPNSRTIAKTHHETGDGATISQHTGDGASAVPDAPRQAGSMRARPGGPTQSVGGAEPGAERL